MFGTGYTLRAGLLLGLLFILVSVTGTVILIKVKLKFIILKHNFMEETFVPEERGEAISLPEENTTIWDNYNRGKTA